MAEYKTELRVHRKLRGLTKKRRDWAERLEMFRWCWDWLRFAALWSIIAFFLVWRGISPEGATGLGLAFALIWKLWYRLGDHEKSLRNQIQELFRYIKEPSQLEFDKERAFETSCVLAGILEKKIVKGMSAKEVEQVLQDYGMAHPEGSAQFDAPNLGDPIRLSAPFGYPTPSFQLEFIDGILEGWRARNYEGLPADLRVLYAEVNKLAPEREDGRSR